MPLFPGTSAVVMQRPAKGYLNARLLVSAAQRTQSNRNGSVRFLKINSSLSGVEDLQTRRRLQTLTGPKESETVWEQQKWQQIPFHHPGKGVFDITPSRQATHKKKSRKTSLTRILRNAYIKVFSNDSTSIHAGLRVCVPIVLVKQNVYTKVTPSLRKN